MLRVLTDDPSNNIMEIQILGRTLLGRRIPTGLELYEQHIGLAQGGLGLTTSNRLISLGVLPGPLPQDMERFLDQALGQEAEQRLWIAWAAALQMVLDQDLGPTRLSLHTGRLDSESRDTARSMEAPWMPALVQGIHTVIDGRIRPRDTIDIDGAEIGSGHARLEIRHRLVALAEARGIDLRDWLEKISKR